MRQQALPSRRSTQGHRLLPSSQGSDLSFEQTGFPAEFSHLNFELLDFFEQGLVPLQDLCVLEHDGIPVLLSLERSALQSLDLGLEHFQVLAAGRARVLLLEPVDPFFERVWSQVSYRWSWPCRQGPSSDQSRAERETCSEANELKSVPEQVCSKECRLLPQEES